VRASIFSLNVSNAGAGRDTKIPTPPSIEESKFPRAEKMHKSTHPNMSEGIGTTFTISLTPKSTFQRISNGSNQRQ